MRAVINSKLVSNEIPNLVLLDLSMPKVSGDKIFTNLNKTQVSKNPVNYFFPPIEKVEKSHWKLVPMI